MCPWGTSCELANCYRYSLSAADVSQADDSMRTDSVRALALSLLYLLVETGALAETDPEHACSRENCSVNTPTVSIIRLIAGPSAYHGQRIRIAGFTTLEREGSAVYLTEDDYDYGYAQNAVWLSLDDWSEKQVQCEKQHCMIEGRFNAKRQGQWSAYSGSLEDIYRMEKSLSRQDIAEIRRSSNSESASQ